MQFVIVIIGAFYIFAGIVAVRMIRLGNLMDGLLEALDGTKVPANERIKERVLTAGAYLTTASGAALIMFGALAPVIFVMNSLVQGGYLFWAATALPPEDADEARGRKQTFNAFVLYAAVTAFVLWLASQGALHLWPQTALDWIAELGTPALACLALWLSLHLPAKSKTLESGSSDFEQHLESRLQDEPQPLPTRLRLAPEWNCWPLWNADTGENVSHYHLDLPFELAERIEAWDDIWQATYNADDPAQGGFSDKHTEKHYLQEGREIAEALQAEWKGGLEIDGKFRAPGPDGA